MVFGNPPPSPSGELSRLELLIEPSTFTVPSGNKVVVVGHQDVVADLAGGWLL